MVNDYTKNDFFSGNPDEYYKLKSLLIFLTDFSRDFCILEKVDKAAAGLARRIAKVAQRGAQINAAVSICLMV